MHAWQKKSAVAIDLPFFNTLPELPTVPKEESDFALLVYKLLPPSGSDGQYQLSWVRIVYASFVQALNAITTPRVGQVADFMRELQAKVDEKLETAPSNRALANPFER